uniref:Predicted protein n=1 Tax=Hordeum vulgare subsp. vulgare TaxID=112509 RepID=F2DJL1_HORVV|nr:predicted protein [Hordeum vulgare subsp. vulgare]
MTPSFPDVSHSYGGLTIDDLSTQFSVSASLFDSYIDLSEQPIQVYLFSDGVLTTSSAVLSAAIPSEPSATITSASSAVMLDIPEADQNHQGRVMFVLVVSTAQDGETQEKSVISVTQTANTNANAQFITINWGSIDPIDIAIPNAASLATARSHPITVPNGISVITITGTPFTRDNAQVGFSYTGISSSGTQTATRPAAQGQQYYERTVYPSTDTQGNANQFVITITAQDGVTTKSYYVNVYVQPDTQDTATIKVDSSSSGTLFTRSSSADSFDVTLPLVVSPINSQAIISVLNVDSYASSVTIDGSVRGGNTLTINGIQPGSSTQHTVVVTAQDGTTQKTYSLSITETMDTNPAVSSLSVQDNNGVALTITPSYDPSISTYIISGLSVDSSHLEFNFTQSFNGPMNLKS